MTLMGCISARRPVGAESEVNIEKAFLASSGSDGLIGAELKFDNSVLTVSALAVVGCSGGQMARGC